MMMFHTFNEHSGTKLTRQEKDDLLILSYTFRKNYPGDPACGFLVDTANPDSYRLGASPAAWAKSLLSTTHPRPIDK